jgi:hypothetical protein
VAKPIPTKQKRARRYPNLGVGGTKSGFLIPRKPDIESEQVAIRQILRQRDDALRCAKLAYGFAEVRATGIQSGFTAYYWVSNLNDNVMNWFNSAEVPEVRPIHSEPKVYSYSLAK